MAHRRILPIIFLNLKISTLGHCFLGNGARGAIQLESGMCLEFDFLA